MKKKIDDKEQAKLKFIKVAKNIKNINIYDYNKEMIMIYGANVNIARAIPDVRDDLKYVERRLLYTMFKDEGLRPGKNRKKVSKIIGTCIGNYYPHGEASIYEVLVKLGQWWNLYPMLIEKQGNYGSIFGEPPAAMRYIECGMSNFTYDAYFSEWSEKICDFTPNYTQETIEPVFLPAKYPMTLIKGTFGIGYGLATAIPPCNINEVLDLTIKLLDDPDMKNVYLYPDFPVQCDIIIPDKKEYIKMCQKGEGSFKSRGNMIVDKDGNIIITSIPYETTTNAIMGKIKELMDKKKMFPEIVDYEDNSKDKFGVFKIDIKLIIKKGYNPYKTMETIYRSTPMENKHTINYEAVYNYSNYHYSMKSLITNWIEFRRETKQRVFHQAYSKAAKDYFNVTFLLKILMNNEEDKLIKIIKKSANRRETIDNIVKNFGITDVQAEAIANLRFTQLSKDNIKNLKDQKAELDMTMKELTDRMSDDKFIDEDIKKELLECKKKYGRKRLCRIFHTTEKQVPDTNHILLITKNGDIKKLPEDETDYGEISSKPVCVLNVNNRDELLLFNRDGQVFSVKVNDIAECSKDTQGVPVSTYIKSPTTRIVSVIPKSDIDDKKYLIFITEEGMIKKTKLKHYSKISTTSGLVATVVKTMDNLQSVIEVENDKSDIILFTTKGKGLRFKLSEVPDTLRASSGVIGIKLNRNEDDPDKDETVVGGCMVNKKDKYLCVMTHKGFGKKCELEYFTADSRAKQGYNLIDLNDNDSISGVKTMRENDTVKVYCLHDDTILQESDIPKLTRKAKGKKLVKVPKGDIVIDIE